VWTRLKVIEYGYKISTATRARRELAEANRRLRLEIAFLTNPGRIARVATEEMGLRPVTPEQVRRLHRPPRVPRGERRGSPAVARMTP
jgi:cell division protein FtsL